MYYVNFMKYIFLFLVFVSVHGVFAQPVVTDSVDSSATNPNFYTENVAQSQLRAGDNNYNSGDAGDQNYNFGTSGSGPRDNYNANDAGGVSFQGSAGLSGSNRVDRLQELDKPNLTIVGITNWFIQIFNYIAILLFSAALVVFLYGVFLLMFVGGTNDESRSKGRKFMFWGIVSLFVMTSTWGLVNVLKSSIFGSSKPLLGPQFK